MDRRSSADQRDEDIRSGFGGSLVSRNAAADDRPCDTPVAEPFATQREVVITAATEDGTELGASSRITENRSVSKYARPLAMRIDDDAVVG
jgi:hypothetical protein